MPITINGIGTKFYGEADRTPDGSFITTEWMVALYLPLIPLRSFRLARDVGSDGSAIVADTEEYIVLQKLPIHWRQVRRVYAFIALNAAWIPFCGWLFLVQLNPFEGSKSVYLVAPAVLSGSLPFFWLWWIRRETFRARYGNRHEPNESVLSTERGKREVDSGFDL